MERLTKRFRYRLGHKDCYVPCSLCDVAGRCSLLEDILEKLAHYEDLEEQLEKLYGGKMPLDKVVETVNRIVQNGEEKLDYARILTNAEAEKWDKWKDLEEQGRLIELPCLPNEEVWISNKRFGTHKMMYASREAIVRAIGAGYAIGYTKEEAEAKLKEMEGVE